ncbi:hypothetical protein [Nocardia sp. NPDC052112]|uniref:hypothetical protein n=1 Tax=Nocardia sp. NPDC052112 TaxID=3155646 RepID=UPI00342E30E6
MSTDLTVHLDAIMTRLVSVVFGLVIQNQATATVTTIVRPLVQHLLQRNAADHNRTEQQQGAGRDAGRHPLGGVTSRQAMLKR